MDSAICRLCYVQIVDSPFVDTYKDGDLKHEYNQYILFITTKVTHGNTEVLLTHTIVLVP